MVHSTPLVITCCSCSLTRYVEVDEGNGTELFYYFVESEAGSEDSPFLLWLTGGDHCSVLSGLALEIGTFWLHSQSVDSLESYNIIPHMCTATACRSIPVPLGALQRHH